MDKTITEAILIGIAVTLAVLLGSYMFTTFNAQRDSTTQQIDQITQMTANLSESDIRNLQGGTVMGSEVLQTIAKLEGSANFYVQVKTNAGNSVDYICNSTSLEPHTGSDQAALMADAKDPKSENYINPTGRFKVSAEAGQGLIYNANDVLVGVVFTQVSAN